MIAHVLFLAVDPGKKCGWAFFDSRGELVDCGLTDGDKPRFNPEYLGLPLLVIEDSHGGRGEASDGDLEVLERRRKLAITTARADRAERIVPNRWKGSVPKMVRTPAGVSYPALDRIRAKMAEPERMRFGWATERMSKSAVHNVLDAVGIGIYWTELRQYPFRAGALAP